MCMYVLYVAFSDVAFILRNISPYYLFFFFAEPYDTKCLWRIVVLFIIICMYILFIIFYI